MFAMSPAGNPLVLTMVRQDGAIELLQHHEMLPGLGLADAIVALGLDPFAARFVKAPFDFSAALQRMCVLSAQITDDDWHTAEALDATARQAENA